MSINTTAASITIENDNTNKKIKDLPKTILDLLPETWKRDADINELDKTTGESVATYIIQNLYDRFIDKEDRDLPPSTLSPFLHRAHYWKNTNARIAETHFATSNRASTSPSASLYPIWTTPVPPADAPLATSPSITSALPLLSFPTASASSSSSSSSSNASLPLHQDHVPLPPFPSFPAFSSLAHHSFAHNTLSATNTNTTATTVPSASTATMEVEDITSTASTTSANNYSFPLPPPSLSVIPHRTTVFPISGNGQRPPALTAFDPYHPAPTPTSPLPVMTSPKWQNGFIDSVREMIHTLVENGVDINKPNAKGETAFFFIANTYKLFEPNMRIKENHGSEVFALLVENEIDLRTRGSYNFEFARPLDLFFKNFYEKNIAGDASRADKFEIDAERENDYANHVLESINQLPSGYHQPLYSLRAHTFRILGKQSYVYKDQGAIQIVNFDITSPFAIIAAGVYRQSQAVPIRTMQPFLTMMEHFRTIGFNTIPRDVLMLIAEYASPSLAQLEPFITPDLDLFKVVDPKCADSLFTKQRTIPINRSRSTNKGWTFEGGPVATWTEAHAEKYLAYGARMHQEMMEKNHKYQATINRIDARKKEQDRIARNKMLDKTISMTASTSLLSHSSSSLSSNSSNMANANSLSMSSASSSSSSSLPFSSSLTPAFHKRKKEDETANANSAANNGNDGGSPNKKKKKSK